MVDVDVLMDNLNAGRQRVAEERADRDAEQKAQRDAGAPALPPG
jgi:hypothetical protein